MGYSKRILKRDEYKCRYCGLDGSLSFSNWLSLCRDHLLEKKNPQRAKEEYIVASCQFCNGANNMHFERSGYKALVGQETPTPEKLVEFRKPFVEETRMEYFAFWEANVRASARPGLSEIGGVAASFAELVGRSAVEVYNEFSLQHEIGIFIRAMYPNRKVQFERSVSFFFPNAQKASFTKWEMDVAVFSNDPANPLFSLELKFPRNGQHPEQMYSFCTDIAFLEELVLAGFPRAALLIFADDPKFYEGKLNEDSSPLYGFFRQGRPIHGEIQKPTGRKDGFVTVKGNYTVKWQTIKGPLKYALVEVDRTSLGLAQPGDLAPVLGEAKEVADGI
jgi:hypothetical protein